MVEINASFEIDSAVVATTPVEEVEKMLKDSVAGNLTAKISDKLEEMSFIDMNLNEETGKFVVEAELVLCSKQSVISNVEVMSTKMKGYGFDEDVIVDVLSTLVEDTGGF